MSRGICWLWVCHGTGGVAPTSHLCGGWHQDEPCGPTSRMQPTGVVKSTSIREGAMQSATWHRKALSNSLLSLVLPWLELGPGL